METEKAVRLETVEMLTKDRDLAQRHIKFLTAARDKLKAKAEMTAEDLATLYSIEDRLKDCKAYLDEIVPALAKAVTELANGLRQMSDKRQSLLLFERYIVLRSIRDIAQEFGYPLTRVYEWHRKARDAYNAANGLRFTRDKRGRRRLYDD